MWFNCDTKSEITFKKHTFLKLPSTQITANQWIQHKAFEEKGWTLISAKEQSEGKGQKCNKWISPKGGLYASLIFLWPHTAKDQVPWVSCAGALSLCEALHKFGANAKVRGYNDVCIDQRKCAGFLTECHFYNDDYLSLILGYGFNFSSKISDFQKEISQSIISFSHLKPEWEDVISQESLLLLSSFEERLFFWLKTLSQNGKEPFFHRNLMGWR
jgi:BirA family transcriptional regulator, biotin operon repressor / biotin---[acetyl-CoA-carboxylase] ligase